MKVKYEINEEEKNHLIHVLKLLSNEHSKDYIRGRDTLLYTASLNKALEIFDIDELDEELLKKQRSGDALHESQQYKKGEGVPLHNSLEPRSKAGEDIETVMPVDVDNHAVDTTQDIPYENNNKCPKCGYLHGCHKDKSCMSEDALNVLNEVKV